MVLLLGGMLNPVFAEITSIQTNNESFNKGETIIFSGTVEKDSTGLVTIVIRDPNNEFVLLSQAIINHDDTFEKTVTIEDRFEKHGVYRGTGFILNMTKGITTDFGVDLNKIEYTIDNIPKEVINQNNSKDQSRITESIIETTEPISEKKNVDFVDPNKDPYHYVQRYYLESEYKSWFDRNYPNLTIEEAVGYTDSVKEIKSKVQQIIDKEIIPEAQASTISQPSINKKDNSDIAQISLAVAGLGILFGAVYGVKRQVDNNSRQISINKDIIRKKIIHSIRGTNPKEIIQTRLAKGEITLDEYEKLKEKLH
jgi:hypothetical protein